MVGILEQEIFPFAVSNTGATAAFSAAPSAETGRTYYLQGFEYCVLGGTTVSTLTVTGISGTTSGTTATSATFTYYQPSTATGATLNVKYSPAIAGAVGGVISVNASANTGATTCAINVQGYFI